MSGVGCVGSAVSVFLLDPLVLYQCRSLKSVRCILSVGQQVFIRCDDFESDYNYNTCIFSKFQFPIISDKEIKGFKFSGKLNSNKRLTVEKGTDKSSSFLYNNLMKRPNFRALRGREKLHLDESGRVQRIVFIL